MARHLTSLLVKNSYTVHSVIRNPAQSDSIKELGAQPVVKSIEDASVLELTSTIKGASPNVVIWAAGAGGGNPERTRTVDQEGAIKSFDATAAAGIKRFIIVSALDVRDREGKPTPEWYNDEDKDRSDKVWGFIGPYMRAKFNADKDLVTNNDKRGLEYTIVRPGGLTQEPATGKVDAGKVHLNIVVSRADVAEVVLRCIEDDSTKGLAFDVVGGDTPITEAISSVGKGQIDTFKGFH